jgi:hypothetical protein
LAGGAVLVAVGVAAPLTAFAEGVDPHANATFLGSIHVTGMKATLRVRYRCTSAENLWISAKETRTGVSANRLKKEGSSKAAAAWWDSHRNRFTCNSRRHVGTFTLDRVEKGTKGRLVPGFAWVQFCLTSGDTEATTKLMLSQSGWVKVTV